MGACQPATFFNSASLLRARGAGGNSQQRQSTAFPAGHAHLTLNLGREHRRRRVAAHAAGVGAGVALAHRLVILLDQGVAAVLSGQGGRAPPARTVWCWPRTILTEAWPQRAAAVPPAAAEPGPPPACHGWPNALGPLGHCPSCQRRTAPEPHLCPHQRHTVLAVNEGKERGLLSREELLHHNGRACGTAVASKRSSGVG